MRTIANQSLFDIAIEKSGDVMATFDWALKNGKSVTDVLIVGEELIAPETEFKDIQIKEYFFRKQIATSITGQESIAIDPQGGVGSMIIEETFIIY